MQLSISEILSKAGKIRSKTESAEWLKSHESVAVKSVLKAMYDPNLICLLPEGPPPYTPSDLLEDHGMLYTNIRKMPYFYQGSGINLTDSKRESLFIELLESVNKEDALLLIDMKDKIPVKGLTKETINQAFPNLITEMKK